MVLVGLDSVLNLRLWLVCSNRNCLVLILKHYNHHQVTSAIFYRSKTSKGNYTTKTQWVSQILLQFGPFFNNVIIVTLLMYFSNIFWTTLSSLSWLFILIPLVLMIIIKNLQTCKTCCIGHNCKPFFYCGLPCASSYFLNC